MVITASYITSSRICWLAL